MGDAHCVDGDGEAVSRGLVLNEAEAGLRSCQLGAKGEG
jgi:hypothetical protein